VSRLFDLTGKIAVVTGSSRGIGRAVAEQLAAFGARVVISSRKAVACEDCAASINAEHGDGRAIAIAANISVKGDPARLIEAATGHWGGIDILICNAATNPYYGPMAGISDDAFRKVLDNNIVANHWLVQFAQPSMIARGGGSIVIISSVGGFRGSPTIGAYNLSKAADMQLARNLAVELGPHNIRVNCIAPGLIKTDFARALWEDPAVLSTYTVSTPLGRIGQPDEIAGAAVFLASDAGAFATGQTFVIDGGYTIAGP